MKTKIIIATHKKYYMPRDEIYLPLHVGHQGKADLGYVGDDSGDNISLKNSSFCELTGLYWAWKNLKCDYLGLAHYRRHFTYKNYLYRIRNSKEECILTSTELNLLIPKYQIILPKKRKYYIESLYSHYEHTHYKEHLEITREIIAEKYSNYLDDFDVVMKHTSGYMFNMFIMEKKLADKYCSWLFDILFELENRMGLKKYSAFQGRFYGRVSEIIFNVWLRHKINQSGNKVCYKEVDCMHMEKINWASKGKAFLDAKFFKKKYEGSF